jgi:hypothetical protein
MATYYLGATASDLTGGADWTKTLISAPETAGSVSAGTGANATDDQRAFTIAGNPGAVGTSSGTFTVERNITGGHANLRWNAGVARVNSAGVVQAGPVFGTETANGTVGIKTFTINSPALGTWVTGDRLLVVYRNRNTSTGTRTTTEVTGTTDTEVTTPGSTPVDATGTVTAGSVLVGGGTVTGDAGQGDTGTVSEGAILVGGGTVTATDIDASDATGVVAAGAITVSGGTQVIGGDAPSALALHNEDGDYILNISGEFINADEGSADATGTVSAGSITVVGEVVTATAGTGDTGTVSAGSILVGGGEVTGTGDTGVDATGTVEAGAITVGGGTVTASAGQGVTGTVTAGAIVMTAPPSSAVFGGGEPVVAPRFTSGRIVVVPLFRSGDVAVVRRFTSDPVVVAS